MLCEEKAVTRDIATAYENGYPTALLVALLRAPSFYPNSNFRLL
jgi:hypothetical protein